MRLCLAVATLAIASPLSIAHACPRGSACETERETHELAATVLDAKVPAPKRLAPGEIEMPWIWLTLREQVYARMPTYEDKGDKSDLRIVLAPVVVKSPTDTVPGIGISGDF